jgi:hypothetical protein
MLKAESKNTKLMTDQMENIFKIFPMFDIKSITDGLTNLNQLMKDNTRIIEGNAEDNKIALAYREELPNVFNQLQQDINKIIPVEIQNKKFIVDQIENMLKLMITIDLKSINDRLSNLNP